MFVGTAEDFDQLRADLETARHLLPRGDRARRADVLRRPRRSTSNGGASIRQPRRSRATTTSSIGALAEGFTGLRTTAELTYAARTTSSGSKIVQYEAQVNEHFARRPFSGSVPIPASLVPPDRVRDVLRTHPDRRASAAMAVRQPVL